MSDKKESEIGSGSKQTNMCIHCLHCHLFHQEKNNNRYFCHRPGKQPLVISHPHTKQTLCEDFVMLYNATFSTITTLCHELHDLLAKREIDIKHHDYQEPVFSCFSHELHVQTNTLLKEILRWEKNNLTASELEQLVRFYYELAGHSILRIAHLQHV